MYALSVMSVSDEEVFKRKKARAIFLKIARAFVN
jgi:hypothetical protein